MNDYGNTVLEISRGKALKWKRILFYLLIICLLLIALSMNYSNTRITISILICVLFPLYIAAKELMLDRTTPILTVYEKGMESELLKPSGSIYIPWVDIKKIEMIEKLEPYYGRKCKYMLLVPCNETKYKSGLVETWVTGKNEYGFNTMSINVSFGLNVDPDHFYSICQSAHKKART